MDEPNKWAFQTSSGPPGATESGKFGKSWWQSGQRSPEDNLMGKQWWLLKCVFNTASEHLEQRTYCPGVQASHSLSKWSVKPAISTTYKYVTSWTGWYYWYTWSAN